MKVINIISIFFLISCLLIGCKNMENRWEDTQSKNTIESYEEFIQDFPESPYNESAKEKIVELHFKNIENSNTILAYEEFLQKYSESKYAEQAQIKVKQLYFQDAKEKNTIEAFTEFISRYPDGSETKEAKVKISELQYTEVRQKNTISDYQEYIEHYPQSPYANEAANDILNIYANKIEGNKSLKDKEAVENSMIKAILKNGIGNRFVLHEILPENIKIETIVTLAELDKSSDDQNTKYNFTKIVSYRSTGQSILAQQIPNTNSFNLKSLYSKDKIYYKLSLTGAEQLKPLGNQCIWRFIGEIEFKDYTFIGNKNEPLTFMLLNKVGFVYLHGKGTVKKNGNLVVILPMND